MKTRLGHPAEEYCVELSYNPRWGLQRSVKLRDMKHGTTPAANYRLVALGYCGHGVGWITVCRKEIARSCCQPEHCLHLVRSRSLRLCHSESFEVSVQGLFEKHAVLPAGEPDDLDTELSRVTLPLAYPGAPSKQVWRQRLPVKLRMCGAQKRSRCGHEASG